jgi:hypothetical protein
MQLEKLQRELQAHILSGDETIAASINATEAVPVATRLRIYSDAYRLRLLEALRDNYPVVHTALGDDDFDALGNGYLETHPSRTRSIRWFGNRLADYVAERHAEYPWLADLARWEWAIAAAFDAADAVPIAIDALAHVLPERWAELTFELHPTLQRLDLVSNVVELYRSHIAETAMLKPEASATPTHWLIWRNDLATRYRQLETDEAVALDLVRANGTFEALCERLCEWHEPDAVPMRAATLLKAWIAEGLVVSLNGAGD